MFVSSGGEYENADDVAEAEPTVTLTCAAPGAIPSGATQMMVLCVFVPV